MGKGRDRIGWRMGANGEHGYYAEHPTDSCNAIVVVSRNGKTDEDGALIVSVAEEQAQDSYNVEFECSIYLTREQALGLRDYLNQTFPQTTDAHSRSSGAR